MADDDASWYGRLDRGIILDAALRLAAKPGVQVIRFRELGVELSADPTAVYRHFRNKAQLLAALIDRLMDRVVAALPEHADWRDVLRVMAREVFDRFTDHPAIGVHLVDARPVGPGELALIEASLRAFADAGLRRDALVSHYSAFSGMLLAYVAAACREKVTRPTQSGETPWLSSEAQLTATSLPLLSSYAPELAALDFRSTYFAGVDVLIESVGRAGTASPD
ncbi:MAG: TetR/AcrR family transcriptional regulator [Protaetiibacter sp.]